MKRNVTKLNKLTHRFLDDESGATAIEYGLIASLIIVAIIASVRSYTETTSSMYSGIETAFDDATN